MSRLKALVTFIHSRRHPADVACEVEAELRFHIEMRTRANIEDGMKSDEAQLAAWQSFGNFDRVKASCCEIKRNLPFDPTPLRMGLHIAIAGVAGGAAYWTVNSPHNNFNSVLRLLISIAVLTFLLGFVRRAGSRYRLARDRASSVSITDCERSPDNKLFPGDLSDEGGVNIASHDEQGLTPVERMFKT